MRDRENSTAFPAEMYINNVETASLITASVIAMFWITPYVAGAVAGEVSQGLPLTVLFGQVFTLEELTEWALIGTQGTAPLNAFFQVNELSAFFGGTKELGAPTGCAGYDEMKQLTEAWCMQLFLMGFAYWLQEKAAAKALADTGGKQGQGTQAGSGNTGWYNPDGSLNYPPNNGAVPGTEVKMTLRPGDTIGRYGNIGEKSNFVTQTGADAGKLALPPNTNPAIYQEFEVIKLKLRT